MIVFFVEELEAGFVVVVDWFVVDEAADADGEAVGVREAVGWAVSGFFMETLIAGFEYVKPYARRSIQSFSFM